MFYVEGELLAEVVLLIVTLRRENGQVLTVTIDADGSPRYVRDNTGYNLGVEELTIAEDTVLKRLVNID